MSGSNECDALTEKRERNREQRLEQIKRWAEYIDSNPPETWGPQLNSRVNSQLESARNADLSTEQYRRIRQVSESRDN